MLTEVRKKTNRLLTQQMENFCLDILKEIPAGKAYFAHYKVKSMAVADVCASQLLRTPKIAERIKDLRERAEDETIGDLREACRISTAIMRGKVSDFTDEHGRIDKTRLDSHAIQSIDEVSTMAGTAVITKLRLHNPLDGIEKLARLKKWYEPEKIINNNIKILVIYDRRENGREAKGKSETKETETA